MLEMGDDIIIQTFKEIEAEEFNLKLIKFSEAGAGVKIYTRFPSSSSWMW